MSSFGVARAMSATGPATAAGSGWAVVLFGSTATLFFFAWILATILRNQDLADSLFCAFSFSIIMSMGLSEARRVHRRRSSRF